MAYGEIRFTNDVDVVVDLTTATLRPFCNASPFPDFYVSEDGARSAAAKGGMRGCGFARTKRKEPLTLALSPEYRGEGKGAVAARCFNNGSRCRAGG
jgi:hypothetical protein